MPYGATPDAKITKTVSPRGVGRAKAPEVPVMNVGSGSYTKVAVFSEVD